MKIGYLRVSTEEQRPDRQIDALKPICDELHIEKISAVAKKRPVFERVLNKLQKGDTLVVWDLDRAFRSTVDAILQAEHLRERGVEFQIVTLNIDTSDPAGEFFYTIMAAYGQLERRIASKRTKEGLQAARKRGQRLGRPPKLSQKSLIAAKQKIDMKEASVAEIAACHGVHPTTLSRALKQMSAKSIKGQTKALLF